jgi:hypothetical protein
MPLYVKDNRLRYVNNFVGLFEQKVDATEDLPVGENLILSASFDKDGEAPPPGVATVILSPAARSTGSRSTSAAIPMLTSSARPRPCWHGSKSLRSRWPPRFWRPFSRAAGPDPVIDRERRRQ